MFIIYLNADQYQRIRNLREEYISHLTCSPNLNQSRGIKSTNSHKKRGGATQTPPLSVTRAFHNELSQVFNLKTNEKRQSIIHKQ